MRPRHYIIEVADRSAIGEARRIATGVADALGFSEERRSDIAIVATEAATNILLHAQKGELLVCPFPSTRDGHARLDLLALDQGPGIANLATAEEDGFSTAGSAGQGIGAMRRQADKLELYSATGKGTAVLARFSMAAQEDPSRGPSSAPFGAVNVPIHGETDCGDALLVVPGTQRSVFMVVDGLGHGPSAKEAADVAVAATLANLRESPAELLRLAHGAMRATRGAAMSVAVADHERCLLTYAGVGNVTGLLTSATQARTMVSQSGTMGAVLPRVVQEYTFPFTSATRLVMFSDGLTTKSSTVGYPGLHARDPQMQAGVLYRDFSRRRDDATVLVTALHGERA